jgi:hypothetical protein
VKIEEEERGDNMKYPYHIDYNEDRQQLKAARKQKIQERFEAYLAIPFWGEFL